MKHLAASPDGLGKGRPRVLCFGEALWDCLPEGRFPGGAPLNVAYHLHQLGCEAYIVTAVGCDPLGDELIRYLESCGLSGRFVYRHESLPTGTVEVELIEGQPTYKIREEVAWDEIPQSEDLLGFASTADAIVYGSLASRSAVSGETLRDLLGVAGPLHLMDVNLRAPFDAMSRVLRLAARADWVKLNEHELSVLTGVSISDELSLRRAAEELRQMFSASLCVTQGAEGASILTLEEWHTVPAPVVDVQDAVGAGDAFSASLLHGLLTGAPLPAVLTDACGLGALVASLPGGQPTYVPPAVAY